MKSCFFMAASLAFLFVVVGCAGCISAPESTGPDHYDLGNGEQVMVHLANQDSDWGLARGCTWTATYQVSNSGSIPAGPVQVNIELVNADSGAVRDSRTIFIGNLAPGESRMVSAELDGECTRDYTVRAIPALA
jgi:hypothetical protein